jgi:purine-binding chemotaxis protein CheW
MEATNVQYLTFFLNGVEYAVDVKTVETVVEHSAVTAVPSPIEYMKGVMELRGKVVPIIDLRRKFGLPSSEDEKGSYVIVIAVEGAESGRLSVGALVDEVSAVVTFEENGIEAARAEESALWERYVRGVVRFEERMIVVIEVEGLFSMREIEAFRAA